MSKYPFKIILAVVVLPAIYILLVLWIRRDFPVRLVHLSPQEEVAIVARRDSLLFFTWAGDMLVRSNGHTVARINLLRYRDGVEDVAAEFPTIEVRNRRILLGGTPQHYTGTRNFDIDRLDAAKQRGKN